MTLFQTKKIRLFILLIIVLVIIMWVFQDDVRKFSFFQDSLEQSLPIKKDIRESDYLERIDNFYIKEYSSAQVLLHTIKADTYFSFNNSPVKLQVVEVQTFNKEQKEGAILKSNQAEIHKSGQIFLNGEVNIKTKAGVSHELETESLNIFSKTGLIKSSKKVSYMGEGVKIFAQGMEMNIDSDIMYLVGNVKILESSGATIETKNLHIFHEMGKKLYRSQDESLYTSKNVAVTSKEGLNIDMKLRLTNLLGDVKIITNSGSELTTFNLLIDQSNDGEIFKSNSSSHFQSNTVDIKSKKMHYDANTKKLKLMDKVLAIYE